ncbi:MAG: XTP/dITP diphosphatase [Dehalococcoidales bacterium]|nr:XTP/dITP diphosphatase [Dehalococcoidales bacterium]
MASPVPPRLLIATNNQGKLHEYRSLLSDVPFTLVSPAELGLDIAVAETGTTFEENARLKALALADACGLLTLADDSGLEVDALGGAPGVYSARYAGEHATDRERISLLLERLRGIPEDKRTARFVCVIAIAAPDGKVALFRGECTGTIAGEPKGSGGFGYDPVFYLPELGRTMAELSPGEKNRLSHRARAAAKAREYLKSLRPEG